MHPARIAELLEPFLGPAQDQRLVPPDLITHISTYIDILLRWNARINLTAIRDPEAIVTRHFGESLFAARHLFPDDARVVYRADNSRVADRGRAALQACPGRSRRGRVTGHKEPEALAHEGTTDDYVSLADLGSGAGFPGLPIKLWAPHISLTLIESHHKKASFLREVARALRLTNVNIQNVRADSLARVRFDVVTLRAVERFDTILPVAGDLVASGGRLALLIGAAQVDPACAALPDFAWSNPEPVPLSRARLLAIAHRPSAIAG